MNYRPDIDGLRAVAVLPVILYHAGFSLFSGGFVGVDVFFVVSGYLITGLIASDLDKSRFSIIDFYERRARRILPALFLVILCTIPFAWVWLLPVQFTDFAQTLVAVPLFMSNIWFWHESGYFAPGAETIPLLHTWSLGVEEQYYMIAPLLLFAAWRFKESAARMVILVCLIGSFGLMEGARLLSLASTDLLFYWPVTRAWEIFIGSYCALMMRKAQPKPNNYLATIGMALILIAIFTFDQTTSFPSYLALLPTVGTALVLVYGGPTSLVGGLLAMRLPVAIGLISYSLYLWHNPVFVLAHAAMLDEPTTSVYLGLTLLSIALAYLSWRFVETPLRVRNGPKAISRGVIFSGSAIGALALIGFGLVGYAQGGFPHRFAPQLVEINKFQQFTPFDCPAQGIFYECNIGDDKVPSSFALLGDSHANRYAAYLKKTLSGQGLSGTVGIHGLCPPLLNYGPSTQTLAADGCRTRMQAKLKAVAADPAIKKVVLAAEWAVYPTGIRFDIKFDPFRRLANDDPAHSDADVFGNALTETVAFLRAAGKEVILLTPLPEYDFNVVPKLEKYLRVGADRTPLDLPGAAYRDRNKDVLQLMHGLADQVTLLNPAALLCQLPDGGCRPYTDALVPLTGDSNHLTQTGTALVGPMLVNALKAD